MRAPSWLLFASLGVSAVVAAPAVVTLTTSGNVTADDLLNQAAVALNNTKTSNSTTTSTKSSSSSQAVVYKPISKTDPIAIAQDVSVVAELYSSAPPVNVRNLRDNTQNTEAVVQSVKTTSSQTSTTTSSDPTQAYPSPITVHAPSIETQTANSTSARRRFLDEITGDASDDAPLSVLFCDPSGNAIWKWNYFAPVATLNATTNSSKQGVCDARTSVKVSSYQAGCSLQNHPNGCTGVLYKGCGGMTVHPETKRVVVARTGGRSLGVLTYKRSADNSTCQGRTVDALTTFKGRKFNSPSDAEFSKSGDLYFTDSPFGLAKSIADFDSEALDTDSRREIPFNGVYVLRNNSKSVELVDCTMDRPNQIAFAPKNDVMYITNSRKHNSYVKAFPLATNGTIGTPSVFFNFTAHPELETDAGYANGIKVDSDGNVFVVAYNGVFVFSSQGELLIVIRSNQELSGVSLGADRMFYTGAFGIATQAGVNFSTVQEAQVDC